MLKCSGLEECSPVKTPIVPGLCLEMSASPLSTEEIEIIRDKPDLGATGKFTWLTNETSTGLVLLMGGGTVFWSSELQSRVACSITEAEFIAGESLHPGHGLFPVHLGGLRLQYCDTSGTWV